MMRTLEDAARPLGTAQDQDKRAFEVMVALEGIDTEGTPIEATAITAITVGVEMSALAMEASTTVTHVVRPSMNLMVRATMTTHNRQGPHRLATDVHTTMS